MSRRGKRLAKLVKMRRALPFGERRFDMDFHEPVLTLSFRRWIYECIACGQPYLVERITSGQTVKPYCSDKCELKTERHWARFNDALAKWSMITRTDPRVLERLDYHKLSPLCAHCKRPFAPNTTLFGQRKRGRPRKYCSDGCRKAAYEKRWRRRHHGKARGHRFVACLDCGKLIDKSVDRKRKHCDGFCAVRFGGRAYRARLKMKAKGKTEFVRGKSGHGAAAKSGRKNHPRTKKLAATLCNTKAELASGRSAEAVYWEGV